MARMVMITPVKGGEAVARKDVIRQLAEAGKSRREIVNILKEEYGHECAYQIVFAATSEKAAARKNKKEAEKAVVPEGGVPAEKVEKTEPAKKA